MRNFDRTKTAMERSIQAVAKRPAIGQLTEFMQIDVAPDGCCSIRDGDATMKIDLPKGFGGGGTTNSAGFHARAALGACLAQGYYVWAAVLGVPIDHLSVEIHADSDSRGVLGIDDSVARSYSSLRYVVNIDSPASRAKIEEVLDKSDDLDWVRDVFARAIPLEREIRITQSEAAE
jgi:uncharacterized OsmC-like protein